MLLQKAVEAFGQRLGMPSLAVGPEGLTALDADNGDVRWVLPESEIHLGAGNSHAVGEDGTAYIGGYYGPDPVAVDANGNVLWQSNSDGCYWLYEIQLVNDELHGLYDAMGDDHDGPGEVVFDLNGALLGRFFGD